MAMVIDFAHPVRGDQEEPRVIGGSVGVNAQAVGLTSHGVKDRYDETPYL